MPPEEDKISFFKNLHIGFEKSIIFDRVKLRGGINQGYIVGGVKIDLYVAHIEYMKYTEEKGSEIGMFDECGSVYSQDVVSVYRDEMWHDVTDQPENVSGYSYFD